jgi:hypothetical protein
VSPDAPLLFLDSGVGGLSVLGPTRALLPTAPIVYVADSAAFPYGTRSEAEIAARVPALLGRLTERFRPRLAVIACNTASTIALAYVRAALDIPVVGTVPGHQAGRRAVRARASSGYSARPPPSASHMSTTSPPASRPTAPCFAMARPSWSRWRRTSCAGAPSIPPRG